MVNTYGFNVNNGNGDESYLEVVMNKESEYVTIGDGANQFCMTMSEWEMFVLKMPNIVRYFNEGE